MMIKSKSSLILLIFGVFSFLLYPRPALAGFWDWIVGAITFLPSAFINLILQAFVLLTGLLSTAAGGILKWVLSPGFISWSYTRPGLAPGENPVIEIGLNITQGFVNMALVLILIYIAMSTILRLAGYQTNKLLINLIIVALLVNFAPVLTGLVVDAANITMYYFTDHITGLQNLGNLAKGSGDSIVASFTTIEVTKQIGLIFQSLVLIVFNIVLFLILLLFALLFVVRYVAIWIAVILAPLAFVSYILPATRGFFKMWWNQFLQWAIIGIIAGFFLFLGEQVSEGISLLVKEGGIAKYESEYGVFDMVLPHMVTMAFLIIGLMMALNTSAMGAGQIVNFGQKVPGWVASRRPVARGLGKLAGGTEKTLGKVSPWLRRLEQGAGRVPFLGKGLRPLAALATRPTGATLRGVHGMAAPGLLRYAARKRKAAIPREFDDMSPAEQESYIKANSLTMATEDRLQLMGRMADKGNLKHTSEEFKKQAYSDRDKMAGNVHYQKDVDAISNIFPEGVTRETLAGMKMAPKLTEKDKADAKREIIKEINNIADEIEKEATADIKIRAEIQNIAKERGIGEAEALQQIAAAKIYSQGIKPGDIAKVADPKSLPFRLAMRDGNATSLQKIRDNFSKKEFDNMFDGTGGLNDAMKTNEALEKLYRKNTGLVKSLFTDPAFRQVNLPGRDNMLNAREGKTQNFYDFEKRMQMKEILRKDDDLGRYNDLLNEISGLRKDINDLEKATKGPVSRATELKLREAKGKLERASTAERDIWTKKIAPDPEKKSDWGRVQRIKNPPKRTRR